MGSHSEGSTPEPTVETLECARFTQRKIKEEQEEMRVVLVSDEAVSCSEGFHREEVKVGWGGG